MKGEWFAHPWKRLKKWQATQETCNTLVFKFIRLYTHYHLLVIKPEC